MISWPRSNIYFAIKEGMSPIQDAFLKFEQKKSAPQINDIHTTDCHFMGPSKFDDSKIFLFTMFQWNTGIMLIIKIIPVFCCNHHSNEILESVGNVKICGNKKKELLSFSKSASLISDLYWIVLWSFYKTI